MQSEALNIKPFENTMPEETEKPVDLVELIYAPDWKTILYDLVQSEKMNAWDINVSELAEKYYEKIKSLTETNLRIPANAMLCSAILLRFKAKKLKISSIEEVEETILIQQTTEEKNKKLYDAFEPFLKNPRLSRHGKVSLNELVSAIEEMMKKTRQKALEKKLLEREFKIPYCSENIEEKSQKVIELLHKNCDSSGLCVFSHLAFGKKPDELVDLFIPILYLCNKGKITAWQEEFFGEIFISIIEFEKEKQKMLEFEKASVAFGLF